MTDKESVGSLILAALGGGAGGGLAGLAALIVNRRQRSAQVKATDATTADLTVTAAGRAVELVMARLDDQQERLDHAEAMLQGATRRLARLEDDFRECEQHRARLKAAVVAAGIPVPD